MKAMTPDDYDSLARRLVGATEKLAESMPLVVDMLEEVDTKLDALLDAVKKAASAGTFASVLAGLMGKR